MPPQPQLYRFCGCVSRENRVEERTFPCMHPSPENLCGKDDSVMCSSLTIQEEGGEQSISTVY